jgi:O-antigen/teichoic acid export membrane protein
VGSSILLWNRSFVHLWVGGENYAGPWTNLLLVIIAVQTAFIRCDAYIIDAALQPGRRVRVSAVAAVIALTLSVALTWYAGLVGLCVGVLAGRATQTIWYPLVVSDCLERIPQLSSRWLVRTLAVTAVLFAGSAYLGEQVVLQHWSLWALAVLFTAVTSFAVAFQWGLPHDLRVSVRTRLTALFERLGHRDFRSGAL